MNKLVFPTLVWREKMYKEIFGSCFVVLMFKLNFSMIKMLLLLWVDIETLHVFMVTFWFRFQNISRYYKVLFSYYHHYLKLISVINLAFKSPKQKKARSYLSITERQIKTEALWTMTKLVSQHLTYLCLRL